MDSELLVEKIGDADNLRRLLVYQQFGIEVMFWAKTSEDGLWQLWIASSAVDSHDVGDARRKVYDALAQIPTCSVTPSEISLLVNTDPIARDAMALRDRFQNIRSELGRRFRDKRLGKIAVSELFLYPRQFPFETSELPDGSWQVLISKSDDLWLSCESEKDAKIIAAAPLLQDEVLGRLCPGETLVAELKTTSDTMSKYRMGFGSRFLRGFADNLREEQFQTH
jgi:hypothetical protein